MNAFYAPDGVAGSVVILTGEEVEHARVLRLKPGDKALAMNGRGDSALCEVTEVSRKTMRLRPEKLFHTQPPKSRAIMAIALSKAARRSFFLEKAAELGAWEIWLWRARASQGKLDDGVLAACAGKIIAGAKQSRNPWFPKLRGFKDARAVAEHARDFPHKILPWERSEGVPIATPEIMGREGEEIFAIGPEAGFLDDETDIFFAAGFEPVSFGDRALRCETAATLCLGLHWWASQLPGHPDFKGALAPK